MSRSTPDLRSRRMRVAGNAMVPSVFGEARPPNVINPGQVIEVLARLDAAGVTVWLDGGWGVDRRDLLLLARRFGLPLPPNVGGSAD
jgi:hypothetical protein